MKKDKQLAEFAEKSVSAYENDEFWEKLKKENASDVISELPQNSAAVKTKRNIVPLYCLAAFVVIICLTVALLWFSHNDKNYVVDDVANESITLEELNEALTSFGIENADNASVFRFYDAKRQRSLYFTVQLTVENSAETLYAVFVVDENYRFDWIHPAYDSTVDFEKNPLTYVDVITSTDGIYQINSYGELTVGDEKVFLRYEGFNLAEESNFVNLTKDVLKIK